LNGDFTVVAGFESRRPKIGISFHADGTFFIQDPWGCDNGIGFGSECDFQSLIRMLKECHEVAVKEMDDNFAKRFAREPSND
jgi:hypothetical protein